MNVRHFLYTILTFLALQACTDPTTMANQQKEEISDSLVVEEPAVLPPVPDYDTIQWTDIHFLDTSILLDLRYATTNNFVNQQLYECPRCLLRPEVAEAVLEAHHILQQRGLGLKLFDCYRPRPVQQKLWDIVPNINYVSPPTKGSMHNRGTAVDITIVDSTGIPLDMGTTFDYFGPEAHHTYTSLSDTILANRQLLKETMATVGLRHIRTEWWHYSYSAVSYELSDMLWNCDGLNLTGSRNKGG